MTVRMTGHQSSLDWSVVLRPSRRPLNPPREKKRLGIQLSHGNEDLEKGRKVGESPCPQSPLTSDRN